MPYPLVNKHTQHFTLTSVEKQNTNKIVTTIIKYSSQPQINKYKALITVTLPELGHSDFTGGQGLKVHPDGKVI